MNAPWRHSLLARMLGWLALHLLLLAVLSGVFVAFQLRMGLESLLSGRTGDRLKDLGEIVSSEFRSTAKSEWPEVLRQHSKSRGVTLDLWRPPDSWEANDLPPPPPDVLARLRERRGPQSPPPQQQRPRGERPYPPPDREDGPPPPPEEEDYIPGLPPVSQGGPPRYAQQMPSDRGTPPVVPAFLLRAEDGGGYWAGIDIPMPAPRPGAPAQRALLVLRSDDLSANGLLLETRPWIFGGFAVLALSVLFWIPFALGITRYLRRLTRATELIADGNFQVSMDTSRRDELGRLGAAVTHMAGRLDHFVSGQRRFLADVAHELCAPLARIRTGLAVLEQTVPPDHHPRLLSVDDDAGELARLIDEILAFSRSGAGKPQPQPVTLLPLIREIADREGPGLHLTLDIPTALTARADPRLLSRAIGNIIRNVRVHAGQEADLVVTGTMQGGQVHLTFLDNGPGVPSDDLPRLFEPFYRPDRSRTRDTGGSGLGLAIVRTCIEATHGRVTASSSAAGFQIDLVIPSSNPE